MSSEQPSPHYDLDAVETFTREQINLSRALRPLGDRNGFFTDFPSQSDETSSSPEPVTLSARLGNLSHTLLHELSRLKDLPQAFLDGLISAKEYYKAVREGIIKPGKRN